MKIIKGAFLKVAFAALLGTLPVLALAEDEGLQQINSGIASSPVNNPAIVVPGSRNSVTVPEKYDKANESEAITNPEERLQGPRVTPGGLITTDLGANISNTPSNITPATTPPLQ